MVRLAAVKNLPGYDIQVGCGPYISSCSHQKTPIMNLVLEWPTKLPPSLGLYPVQQQTMAEKTDPVIDLVEEEEEEEWPEAGAQNVEEAEHYH